MKNTALSSVYAVVALLAEGVDRNIVPIGEVEKGEWVALLAEGVDRNTSPGTFRQM